LDFVLSTQYHGQLHKAEYDVLNLLRSGLYQMDFMESVPPAVAINETVEVSKRVAGKRVSGLINGVLRSVKRERSKIEQQIQSLSEVKRLSVKESHPEWLVERWIERYGYQDAQKLCHWNNRRPNVTVRVNTTQIPVEKFAESLETLGIEFTQSPHLVQFFEIAQAQELFESDQIPSSWFAVQDVAAGLTASLIEAGENQLVLDACAAPGGKSTYILQNAPDSAQLIAYDSNSNRLRKVDALAKQLQLTGLETRKADASEYDFPEADWILLDVPCTGTGVLAKRADSRWKKNPVDIKKLSDLQYRILENAARSLKPEGKIVYSTCTLEPEENWGVVKKFLEQNQDFTNIKVDGKIPESMIDERGALNILPHIHQMDGAFAVILTRRNNV
ncbi:MAG: 16S rRNA (cytosine(967)-C(5))-methyltransferase RsmB, partial [Candidatus Marinimicrobia bacterium]|nr:16S rRNA (cytosine(967)-C(5))-methyltransferase RsmB [Candidatus Neomarinimicrobiota bacterium]